MTPRKPSRATRFAFAESMKLAVGLLIAASAANAGPGFVAAMTKSTSSNAAAIASFAWMRCCSATAAVWRLYIDCESSSPIATSSVRSAAQPASGRRDRRAGSRGCPSSTAPRGSGARSCGRPRSCPVLAMSAAADARSVLLDAGLERDAAERGNDRDAPAAQLVACRGRLPSRAAPAGSTGRARRSPRTRRSSAPRRAPTGRGTRARRCRAGSTRSDRGGCGRTCPSCRAGRCSRRGCGSSRRRRRRSRAATRPPATAAALPADDPPTVRPCRHGLCVTPLSFVTLTLSPPNSLAVVSPTGTAPPAPRSRSTIVLGARRDAVAEDERAFGRRPAGDRLELLDADRHAAERLRDVGALGRAAARARRRRTRTR